MDILYTQLDHVGHLHHCSALSVPSTVFLTRPPLSFSFQIQDNTYLLIQRLHTPGIQAASQPILSQASAKKEPGVDSSLRVQSTRRQIRGLAPFRQKTLPPTSKA